MTLSTLEMRDAVIDIENFERKTKKYYKADSKESLNEYFQRDTIIFNHHRLPILYKKENKDIYHPEVSILFDDTFISTINISGNQEEINKYISYYIYGQPIKSVYVNVTYVSPYDHMIYENVSLNPSGGRIYSKFSKKSYNLEFTNATTIYTNNENNCKEHTLFGLKSIDLTSEALDATFLRKKLYSELLISAGLLTTKYTFCRLYINNNPIGLYLVSETKNKEWFSKYIGNEEWYYMGNKKGTDMAYLGEIPLDDKTSEEPFITTVTTLKNNYIIEGNIYSSNFNYTDIINEPRTSTGNIRYINEKNSSLKEKRTIFSSEEMEEEFNYTSSNSKSNFNKRSDFEMISIDHMINLNSYNPYPMISSKITLTSNHIDKYSSFWYSGDPTLKEKNHSREKLVQLFKDLTNTGDENLDNKFNIEDFLKYLALEYLAHNWDNYMYNGKNYYLYYSPLTQRWNFMDGEYDYTFGLTSHTDPGVPYTEYRLGKVERQPFDTLMKIPKYKKKFEDITKELMLSTFNRYSIDEWIETYRSMIRQDINWNNELPRVAVNDTYIYGPSNFQIIIANPVYDEYSFEENFHSLVSNYYGKHFGINQWVKFHTRKNGIFFQMHTIPTFGCPYGHVKNPSAGTLFKFESKCIRLPYNLTTLINFAHPYILIYSFCAIFIFSIYAACSHLFINGKRFNHRSHWISLSNVYLIIFSCIGILIFLNYSNIISSEVPLHFKIWYIIDYFNIYPEFTPNGFFYWLLLILMFIGSLVWTFYFICAKWPKEADPCSDNDLISKKFGFVIPAHNSSEALKITLPALLRIARPNQIYICDNGSNEKEIVLTDKLLHEFSIKFNSEHPNEPNSFINVAHLSIGNKTYAHYATMINIVKGNKKFKDKKIFSTDNILSAMMNNTNIKNQDADTSYDTVTNQNDKNETTTLNSLNITDQIDNNKINFSNLENDITLLDNKRYSRNSTLINHNLSFETLNDISFNQNKRDSNYHKSDNKSLNSNPSIYDASQVEEEIINIKEPIDPDLSFNNGMEENEIEYVTLMDDDVILPKNWDYHSCEKFFDDPTVSALAYPIYAENANDNLTTLLQDCEYLNGCSMRYLLNVFGNQLFTPGAITTWRADQLLPILHRHTSVWHGDDMEIGCILNKYCGRPDCAEKLDIHNWVRQKYVINIMVPTIVPTCLIHWYDLLPNPLVRKLKIKPHSCGEKSLFTQRIRSWDLATNRQLSNFVRIIFSRGGLFYMPKLIMRLHCLWIIISYIAQFIYYFLFVGYILFDTNWDRFHLVLLSVLDWIIISVSILIPGYLIYDYQLGRINRAVRPDIQLFYIMYYRLFLILISVIEVFYYWAYFIHIERDPPKIKEQIEMDQKKIDYISNCWVPEDVFTKDQIDEFYEKAFDKSSEFKKII